MFRSAGRYKNLNGFLFSLFRIRSETPKTIIQITYYKIWSSFISQRSMESLKAGDGRKSGSWDPDFLGRDVYIVTYLPRYLWYDRSAAPHRPKKIRMQSSGLSTFFSLRFNVLKLILIDRIGCSLNLPHICVQPVSNCKPWSHATSYIIYLTMYLFHFN
jgi:hypothetical protein